MRYAAFSLATHTNAALAGRLHFVPFPRVSSQSGMLEWVFYALGPNGRKLRSTPQEWVEVLRSLGAQRAWFGYDLEFRSEGIWIEGVFGLQFYWIRDEVVVPRERTRISINGRAAPSEQRLLPSPVREAAKRLGQSLEEIIEYAKEEKRKEFLKMLMEAQDILQGDDIVLRGISKLFPDGLYPPENPRLLGAATSGDVFGNGGMGSWFDFHKKDEERFRVVTENYTNAFCEAFPAASFLDLVVNEV